MSKRRRITPRLLFAEADGQIYDHPELLMVCRRGPELALPRPDELIPLPEGSELFLLPGRRALGLDPETGELEEMAEAAVAAFVSPGYTLAAQAAYRTTAGAPRLPLFAYGAVGYASGKLWVPAIKVDEDPRQVFTGIPESRIRNGAQALMKAYPDNRLVRHLAGCALTYACPAAKNLALGRFEAPLPTSRACNASCVGCISCQPKDSGFPATQERIGFTPTPSEIVQIMGHHAGRVNKPVLSFGQGCEGEPLTETRTIAAAIKDFRSAGGRGTVNMNTNGSLPQALGELRAAGLDSVRVSLNSVRAPLYSAYYRPKSFAHADVLTFIAEAKRLGLFVSLNYLFVSGVNDTEDELAALTELAGRTGLDFIQMRNLNLDPELYLGLVPPEMTGPSMGLGHFMSRLAKACPGLRFGYFNPYLG
jgi:pyruvate-formate lyase-activating enzyme